MGIKEQIHSLKSVHDFPILITEELHQVYSVQGYKKKKLADLLNAFGRLSYLIEINFPQFHSSEWVLQNAGRLQTHVTLAATINLRLHPPKEQLLDKHAVITTDQAVKSGTAFFRAKASKLQIQHPNDADAVFEFMGRLLTFFPLSTSWEWYLCPKSGTSLNFHIQPTGTLNPALFLRAQKESTVARISTINIYPYTVEIVFHAFSQIEHLPYNRRHQTRFLPY